MTYSSKPHSSYRIGLLTLAITFACVCFSLFFGSTQLAFADLLKNASLAHHLFFDYRLPHTINTFLIGGLLALAGMLVQLLTQNSLADPYLMGISLGAAFFSLLMMLLNIGGFLLFGSAWAGSVFTILLIFLLAKKQNWRPAAIMLSGISLATLFSAGISLILLLTPPMQIHGALFWLAGDLSQTTFSWLPVIILLGSLVVCYFLAPGFNLLCRGELSALALGLSLTPYRLALFLLSALCTTAAVTMAGSIGFIGLIVPHLTRCFLSEDYRLSLFLAVLLGGACLTCADTLSRILFAPEILPINLILALCGLPLFIWLLQSPSCRF